MRRGCARPGCGEPARVTLSYDYGGATVWLDDLHPEPHPMTHDLCARHGGTTGLPRGWELVDRRRSVAVEATAGSTLRPLAS